jgi:hypothetical protein
MMAPHYLLACVLGGMLFGLAGLWSSERGRPSGFGIQPQLAQPDAWELFVRNGYPVVVIAGVAFGALQVWGPLTRPMTFSRAVR